MQPYKIANPYSVSRRLPRNILFDKQFLEFGHEFNREVERLPLPASLQHIRFFHKFNQVLDHVSWPQSLRHVWLCGNFGRPINNVLWPPALKVSITLRGVKLYVCVFASFGADWPSWLRWQWSRPFFCLTAGAGTHDMIRHGTSGRWT